MKLADLEIHINNWRILNITRRTINVFLNEIDYNDILNEHTLCEYNNLDIGFILFNSVKVSRYGSIVKKDYCYINADCGSNISKVLTKNERIIKNIIE